MKNWMSTGSIRDQQRSGKNSVVLSHLVAQLLIWMLTLQGPCEQHIRAEFGAAEWLQKTGGDHRYRIQEAERKWIQHKNPSLFFLFELNPFSPFKQNSYPLFRILLFYWGSEQRQFWTKTTTSEQGCVSIGVKCHMTWHHFSVLCSTYWEEEGLRNSHGKYGTKVLIG